MRAPLFTDGSLPHAQGLWVRWCGGHGCFLALAGMTSTWAGRIWHREPRQ